MKSNDETMTMETRDLERDSCSINVMITGGKTSTTAATNDLETGYNRPQKKSKCTRGESTVKMTLKKTK